MNTVNWGIIGPGGIAKKFITAVNTLENANVIACASNSLERAKSFGEKYNLQYVYASYEEMLKNPEINAVYIANTHNFHYESVKICLENNKNVLCEKAFTLNSVQARELMNLAKKNNLFLMEAMWTRYLPANVWARKMIAEGEIGELLHFEASYGFKFKYDINSRAFNINLAGGGLLDLGIYPLSYSTMIFGSKPEKMLSVVTIGGLNVDESATISLLYKNKKTASFTYSMTYTLKNDCIIYGTEGKITIPAFVNAESAILTKYDGETIEFSKTHENGFVFEVQEATNMILQGEKESSILPVEETVEIMELCDRLRNEWGLKYPDED